MRDSWIRCRENRSSDSRDEGVSVANYNCPGQIVLTGKAKAVEKAAEHLKEAGAKRTVMLNVSGPFHSTLLTPGGKRNWKWSLIKTRNFMSL